MTTTIARVENSTRVSPWTKVWVAIFVCCWGGNQFSPLLLMYQQRAHYSSVVVNALLAVYIGGLIPALLIAGALSDRHGRKPTMLIGVVATVVGSLLLACGPMGLPALVIGRLFSGIGVGIAMAVGTSWMAELSRPPYDMKARPGAGARRSAVVFGTGSAVGALVAGLFAQWGPQPEVLPFVIHVVFSIPAVILLIGAPETRVPQGQPVALRDQIRIPSIRHRRFVTVVATASPWLFGAAAIVYGYLPTQLPATGSLGLIFATTASIIALGTSALVQPLAGRIHSHSSARGLIVAVTALGAGIALATITIATQIVVLGLVAACVVGVGIGLGQVSALLEVQRLAGPEELGSLTGVFYSLAYAGFLLPVFVAALAAQFSTIAMLWALVAGTGLSLLMLVVWSTRSLPESERGR